MPDHSADPDHSGGITDPDLEEDEVGKNVSAALCTLLPLRL